MAARFEMEKTPSGYEMFNLKAGSGQTILTGEPYRQLAGAINGIQPVMTSGPAAEVVDSSPA